MSSEKYEIELPIRLIVGYDNGLRVFYEDSEGRACWESVQLSTQGHLLKFIDGTSVVKAIVTEKTGLLNHSVRRDIIEICINRNYQKL